MKSLAQIMDQAMALKSEISKLLLASTYKEYSDLSGLDINYGDSEQLLQLEVLRDITEKLAELEEVLIYMNQPVKGSGRLEKCKNGFCELDSKCLFIPGSRLEVLVTDKEHLVPFWGMTKLCYEPAKDLSMAQEAKDGDIYYFDGYEDVPVEGATIRYRGHQFYLDHTYR